MATMAEVTPSTSTNCTRHRTTTVPASRGWVRAMAVDASEGLGHAADATASTRWSDGSWAGPQAGGYALCRSRRARWAALAARVAVVEAVFSGVWSRSW